MHGNMVFSTPYILRFLVCSVMSRQIITRSREIITISHEIITRYREIITRSRDYFIL